ncbi:MAG TPA: hypothetical protein VGK19_20660 [Capsulimonadaceae bacterium]
MTTDFDNIANAIWHISAEDQMIYEAGRYVSNPAWDNFMEGVNLNWLPWVIKAIKFPPPYVDLVNEQGIGSWWLATSETLAVIANAYPGETIRALVSEFSPLGEPSLIVSELGEACAVLSRTLGLNRQEWVSDARSALLDLAINAIAPLVTNFSVMSQDAQMTLVDCLEYIGGKRGNEMLAQLEQEHADIINGFPK